MNWNRKLSFFLVALNVICQTGGLFSEESSQSYSPKKGKSLYKKNCAACHGKDGQGHTPMARSIPNLPDLTDLSTKKKSDQELFDIITNGSPPMPSFSQLSEEDRWDLVKYIRALEK